MAASNSLDIQRHALDYWQIVRNRLGLITLSFLFIFAAAAVLTYIMPRKYRGHVEMTIERITQDINVFDRNRGDSLRIHCTRSNSSSICASSSRSGMPPGRPWLSTRLVE